MKKVYGYIRVSTKRQGEGVSLEVQEDDIKRYAKRKNLKIIAWVKEKKSASKGIRPKFSKMIQDIYQEKADGFIAHKIDRMMRNRGDWAMINDLIDSGRVIHSVNGTELDNANGRFMGDIEAAVATRYSSNLSEEAKKGLYGRLKQGIYPWGAPVGYDNTGKGNLKKVNPIQSELIKQLFDLYVSENYNVRTLSVEMEKRGLRNKNGNRVCKNGITTILKNPFYIGLMKVKGKTYKGNHKTIIDPRIFKQVKMILEGRKSSKGLKHHYLFRKLVRCENCRYIMSGEKQKGHVYYRCQTKGCPTKSIREDLIQGYVKNILKTLSLSNKESMILNKIHDQKKAETDSVNLQIKNNYSLQIHKLEKKEQKLLDIYLEDGISKNQYEKQRLDTLIKLQELKALSDDIPESKNEVFEKINKFLELCKSPINTYLSGIQEEKREMLEIITSNLTIDRRKVSFSMVSPFGELANRDVFLSCPHSRDTGRTLYGKIVYLNNNTSSVIPKALNDQQLEKFYQFLMNYATTLSKINKF
ncbi:MAG: hypothetical protein COB12_06795 [Flavobacterium sp.]|nr:MAG: hypothetical protein COB12_06795 [Flavobacterium sp.]